MSPECRASSSNPAGTWTVRLASGLANDRGDGFADVPASRGALPGQPNVYNVAFRTHEQEKAHLNFWSDEAQAAALSDRDVSEFSLAVTWDRLAVGRTTEEPVVKGTSTRWYVSSIELGQGIAATNILDTEPQFLGRVQPYSVCLPSAYAPGRKLPLTLLLHSLALGQNQFAAIDPRLLGQVCEDRESVVVTPLARGPSCWYFDEAELDVWEVWARVSEQLGADPNRTVIAGYSMGGYAAYKLGLTYPEVFAQAVALAGPPVCGVRLLPNVEIPGDLDPNSHCAREGDTWELLPNGRWLPFVIAHGVLDQLVPITSVLSQVLELDRLGYRYRFTVYPFEDHISWALEDEFDDPISHMRTDPRQGDPGHITFSWYPGAGTARPRHWAAPGLVVVEPAGRSGPGPQARSGRGCRRAVVRASGPVANDQAPPRHRTGSRRARPVHRIAVAHGPGRRADAVPDTQAHGGGGGDRRRRPGRAYDVGRIEHRRVDRHLRARDPRRVAARHGGVVRR